jgi:carboxymethylenebutenolidase
MTNEKNYVDLVISDNSSMAAYTAFPENTSGKSPAIILLQEAFGVNGHMRKVADDFANEGYIVICPELFHRTAKKFETFNYNDFPSVMPHYSALSNDGLTADLQACFQWLTEQSNVDTGSIFSIGYCLGGKVSFLANAVLPIKAGVSYYGGSTDQLADKATDLHGKHLFFWGGLDTHIKNESIATVINALDAAGKEYINVKISFAGHGFACEERPSYNETAANDALALTLAFMKNS